MRSPSLPFVGPYFEREWTLRILSWFTPATAGLSALSAALYLASGGLTWAWVALMTLGEVAVLVWARTAVTRGRIRQPVAIVAASLVLLLLAGALLLPGAVPVFAAAPLTLAIALLPYHHGHNGLRLLASIALLIAVMLLLARLSPLQPEAPRLDALGTLALFVATAAPLALLQRYHRGITRLLAETEAAHAELATREARYRVLSELMSDYVYSVRILPDGTLEHEWLAGAFTRITGYTPEELGLRGTWTRHIHPDDLANVLHELSRCLSGSPGEVEYRIITRDGQLRWLHEYGHPEWNAAQQRVVRIIGAVQDISERVAAEAAVRESAERLRRITDGMLDMVSQTDAAGHFEYVSPSHTTILGYPADELLGRHVLDLVHPDDRPPMAPTIEAILHNEASTSYEFRYRHAAGHYLWLEAVGSLLHDDEGRTIGAVFGTRDSTARHVAEEERRALTQKMLDAQKLESLGVLAGGIAHDFNNLLMVIQGNTSLLATEVERGSPAALQLGRIEAAAARAAELTRQLLAYAGKGRFVIQPLDLNEAIRDVAAVLQSSTAPSVALRCRLAPRIGQIEADATQLRQLITNLVMNAADAVGQQAGTITISTGQCEVCERDIAEARFATDGASGPHVFVEVADTGCGMDAATIARVFDPFFTTKLSARGLGLAATLGIVRSHRGTLKLQSTPGHGTIFTVLFPRLADEDQRVPIFDQPVLVALSPSPPTAAVLRPPRRTALLVDDESNVRIVVALMLERAGFHVLTAADGREGVELFRSRSDEIDCVLLDLVMPHLSGEQALREMRRHVPGVRVVLMSGYTREELFARLAEPPAGFLQKPFNAAQLAAVLRGVIESEAPRTSG